jgi:large subunit ribosomal protein L7/L12
MGRLTGERLQAFWERIMAITKEEFINYIENMTVIELAALVKELEEKFGVTAAAPMAVMPAAGGAAGAAAEAPIEQTEFDVILTGSGEKKIQVIKVVRELTGLGLKEAKAVVDEAPKPVKQGISKDEAATIRQKLEEVGATVEVK